MLSPLNSLNMASVPEQLLKAYCQLFPLQKGKLRVVNALWPLLIGGKETQRTAQLDCGYKMPCNLNKLLQRQYYFFGTYFTEKQALADWRTCCKTASTIFDIGANSGIYSLEAASGNLTAKVFAFEPTPAIAAHLRQTCQLNSIDNIEVVEKAVGSTSQPLFLNFCGAENEGMNFTTTKPRSDSTLTVNQITLDQFCQTHGIDHIDLLKMDVQGNEADVLSGAQYLLAANAIRTIFFEVNPVTTETGHITYPAAAMLCDYGFRFRPAAHPDWPLQTNFRSLQSFEDWVAIR